MCGFVVGKHPEKIIDEGKLIVFQAAYDSRYSAPEETPEQHTTSWSSCRYHWDIEVTSSRNREGMVATTQYRRLRPILTASQA
jgi:hypothetical protein